MSLTAIFGRRDAQFLPTIGYRWQTWFCSMIAARCLENRPNACRPIDNGRSSARLSHDDSGVSAASSLMGVAEFDIIGSIIEKNAHRASTTFGVACQIGRSSNQSL